jgi:uncharacterized protein (TIGR02466 family)
MTHTEDINVFPTLVRAVSNFLTVSECSEIVSNIDRSELAAHKALVGNAVSNHISQKERSLESINRYFNIKDRLKLELDRYSETTGISNTDFANSWISIQYKNSELQIHTHPLSAISGVIYLQVDEDSSKLNFFNPNPFMNITEISEYTPYTFGKFWITPKIGDLILFPSWLSHGSDGINNSDERIILSFNTYYTK